MIEPVSTIEDALAELQEQYPELDYSDLWALLTEVRTRTAA